MGMNSKKTRKCFQLKFLFKHAALISSLTRPPGKTNKLSSSRGLKKVNVRRELSQAKGKSLNYAAIFGNETKDGKLMKNSLAMSSSTNINHLLFHY